MTSVITSSVTSHSQAIQASKRLVLAGDTKHQVFPRTICAQEGPAIRSTTWAMASLSSPGTRRSTVPAAADDVIGARGLPTTACVEFFDIATAGAATITNNVGGQ